MVYKSSKIIRRYVLREILGTTLLCTLVLTTILLYGNLSKYDEDLFRALSISPLLFLELISLMLPFALSLGLPFGFSLAVIFCVGRWSGDREILGMRSLGMRHSAWSNPIFATSVVISLVGCFASMHWSPVSRGAFEKRVKEIAWHDFQSWIDSGNEIGFNMDADGSKNILGGIDSELSQQIKRATMTIGHGLGDKWKNVRILMWGNEQNLLAILHAKRSTVIKDRKAGTIELFLHDVDYESFKSSHSREGSKNKFVSFRNWKTPISFSIETPQLKQNIKRIPFVSFLKSINEGELGPQECALGFEQFNKYASIGLSPISLCPLILSVAIRSGRKETYANLFIGAFICLVYFALGSSLGESIGNNGIGWWFSNFLAFFAGFLCFK